MAKPKASPVPSNPVDLLARGWSAARNTWTSRGWLDLGEVSFSLDPGDLAKEPALVVVVQGKRPTKTGKPGKRDQAVLVRITSLDKINALLEKVSDAKLYIERQQLAIERRKAEAKPQTSLFGD